MKKISYPFFLVLLAFVLRLFSLRQSLWLDEATTALVAKDPAGFFNFISGDFHPPLYYLLMQQWVKIVGTSEIALRMPSVIIGAATVYVVYRIGKRVADETTALIAALLMATAPLHIYYSQEARMYSLSTFLVSLLVYAFLSTTAKKPKRVAWVAFSFLVPAVFLTDYLPMLILPVVWVVAYMKHPKSAWWKKFFVAHIPLVVAMIVWYPTFLTQLANGVGVAQSTSVWNQVLGSLNAKNIALIPVKFMIGRINFTPQVVYALVVAVFGGICVYLLNTTRGKKMRDVWLWLIVPISLGTLISGYIPVLSYFRFLFVLPAWYLLLAFGLSKASEVRFFPLLVVVLLLNIWSTSRYLTTYAFWREDWRWLVADIQKTQGAAIVFPSESQHEAITYYWDKAPIKAAKELSNDVTAIWYIPYVEDISDPTRSTRTALTDLGFREVSQGSYNGVTGIYMTR